MPPTPLCNPKSFCILQIKPTFMQKPLILSALLCFMLSAVAQPGRQWDRPMELQRCSVDVQANLFTATTFIEMEFYNPNNQEIEGLFKFQLNPGQAVTSLQLDLFGKLRDGSIEERWKAANAYNTIVGKKVDPALLQMDSYNSYSLRIYPVPGKGTRRITMTIQQVLRNEGNHIHYSLPIAASNKIGQLKIAVRITSPGAHASADGGLLEGKEFVTSVNGQELTWQAADVHWNKPLRFSMPVTANRNVFACTGKEQISFALWHQVIRKEEALQPKKIAIYWDVSYSAGRRDTEKEIAFFKEYIETNGIASFYIVPFNYTSAAPVYFSAADKSWMQFLRSLKFEGGTRLGALDFRQLQVDAHFLVSDGFNSLGNALPAQDKQPVFCIQAAPRADHRTLQAIIGSSGGKSIDLNKISVTEAVSLTATMQWNFLGIRSASGGKVAVHAFEPQSNMLLVYGTTRSKGDTLFFDYGVNNRQLKTEAVLIHSSETCEGEALGRIPALLQFDEILRAGRWQQLLLFGKDERMVTYRTSFIVLEKAEDYVKFNIKPPVELEEECERILPGFLVRNKNQQHQEQLQLQQRNSRLQMLTAVTELYNARQKRWGGNDFIVLKEENLEAVASKKLPLLTTIPAEAPVVTPNVSNSNLSEVVVVGFSQNQRSALTAAASVVRSSDLFGSATSVEQALNGRVAGLVAAPNNQWNSGYFSSIQVRGLSSLSANSSPLFVLDGIPITGDKWGRVNINEYVNVSDIDFVQVLKDAAATAIYGSRGANGVIIIKTKKARTVYWSGSEKQYKLSSMEDVDYLQEIKAVARHQKWETYKQLQSVHGKDATFYLDMAQHLYEHGFIASAKAVLTNATEVVPYDLSLQKTIASYFQQWGEWQEALLLYEEILKAAPGQPLAYRDLALAYSHTGQYQKAIETLYAGMVYDHEESESRYVSHKEILLNELNAIVAVHQQELDLSLIPAELIKPLPVDLRIVIESTTGQLYGITIVEPKGKQQREWQWNNTGGGYLTNLTHSHFIKEYQYKSAPGGRYKIRLNYYDYGGDTQQQPQLVKVTIYKNFGRQNQQVTVENVLMNNQWGDVEIKEFIH